ncbi:MAG TPA: hypothetical protein VFG03_03990 [Telluria sp.]|nr:hypothetical protein [Telluria sp.]
MAPVTLATLQGSTDADPAAVAAAVAARPPVDGLAEAYRAAANSRPVIAAAASPTDVAAPAPATPQ